MNVYIKKRNDELAENRNLIIELDPQIAAAFKTSLNISSKLPLFHETTLTHIWCVINVQLPMELELTSSRLAPSAGERKQR